jgi:hypothetical protein
MNKNDSLGEFVAIYNLLPSRADETLTSALKQALALVDAKVLDLEILPSSDGEFPAPGDSLLVGAIPAKMLPKHANFANRVDVFANG